MVSSDVNDYVVNIVPFVEGQNYSGGNKLFVNFFYSEKEIRKMKLKKLKL